MSRPWFDPKTESLLLDQYVAQMSSYQKIVAENVVTTDEIRDQAHRVVSLLKKLEQMLSPEAKEVATDALCELALLYNLERKHAMSTH